MRFSRIHVMILLCIAACIWILFLMFTGKAVLYEHFPVRPLE